MPKLLLLILFISSPAIELLSQKIIKGKIVELNTNNPIPYANIGIRNSPIGTISNIDGTFFISIPGNHLNDTITFSALGYLQRSVPVILLNTNKSVTIFLSEKEKMLQEVTVSS